MRRYALLGLILVTLVGILVGLNRTVFRSVSPDLPKVTFRVSAADPDLVTKSTTYRGDAVSLPVFDNPALNALLERDYASLESDSIDYELLTLTPEIFSLRLTTSETTHLRTYTRTDPRRLLLSDLLDPVELSRVYPGDAPSDFGLQDGLLLTSQDPVSLAGIQTLIPLETLALLDPAAASTEQVTRARADLDATLALRLRAEQDTLDTSTNCALISCVALTFDDGPSEETEALLDILRTTRTPATFYVLGQEAARYPDTLKRIVADGHTLGNHTYHHPDLTTLDPEDAFLEITRTQELIYDLTGRYPLTYRPPYGATIDLPEYPFDQVLWSQDTRDWQSRDTEEVIAAATTNTAPGAIILLHDIHPESVAAVPDIIRILKTRGFVFVTVEDLLTEEVYTPGGRLVRSRTQIN